VRTNRNRIEFLTDRVRRFPLTEHDRADLPGIAVRHEAARELGLPVPRVLDVRTDHLVLERLPGTPLITTTLHPLAQHRLGRDLAAVLTVLRRTRAWPLPATDWAQLWADLATAAPESTTRAAARLAAGMVPALVHGDLSGGNLLVTEDGGLSGLLDWDGATLADPAQDFHALCANVPAGVAQAVRTATPEAAELQRRADVYMATWPAQNRLWQQGRHPWLRRVLAERTG
jgi:aminoglycoside phosphotransferase (APT) family kinase protein